MDRLRTQDQVEHRHRSGAEEEDGARVPAPVLLGLGARAEQAVEAALERPESAVQDDRLAAVHTCHVAAEERRQRGEDDEEEDDLRPAGDVHTCSRPRTSAHSAANTSAATTTETMSP